MKQRKKKHTDRRRSVVSSIIGVGLILIGILVLMSLLGFHPEDSLYFRTDPPQNIRHFMGKIGVSISSPLKYYIGRGSFFFAFFLLYSGYILLRNIPAWKKTAWICVVFCACVFSMGVFARPGSGELHTGGGIFGQFIVDALSHTLRKDVIFILFTILFSTAGALALKHPVSSMARLFSGKKDAFEQGARAPENENRDYLKNQKMKVQKRSHRGKKKKPPLIQKVYLDEERMYDVESEREASEARKGASPLPLADEKTGQYYLSEGQAEARGVSPRKVEIRRAPDISFLKKSKSINKRELERETFRKARELERTLSEFGIEAKVSNITRGPVITRYELQPAAGVKLSRIVNLSDNIALSLSANGVRIEAPIPGRAAVGIEIPNEQREIVTLGDIITETGPGGELPLILGKDISGKVVVTDLVEMPHLLIAGATGSGKSVCVNSLIVSMLFHKDPEEVRFIMIDPKMVELKIYNGIPHLLTEVVTDPRDASKVLRWLIYEMENRYKLLDEHFVRDISSYNKKQKDRIPYIVVIVDEFANLMAISQKEVEDAVVRIAAMSRAVGIHLIMATQRPSVDVITGLIKANFPFRIAFQVASKTDSRTILDTIGAEKLLGRGDMLFAPAGSANVCRIQGAYIQEDEVMRIVDDLKKSTSTDYLDDILSFEGSSKFDISEEDPIFDDAVEIVLRTKRASASFLQRRLKIGYNRAARLIELMEEKGIIGPPRGSKPREIYIDRMGETL
jgi:DNA segregation ATPase FtsK/SpoIIIE-like protein